MEVKSRGAVVTESALARRETCARGPVAEGAKLVVFDLASGRGDNPASGIAASVCPARTGKPQECEKLARRIVENPMLNGSAASLDGAPHSKPR
ncbi:MAG: hypothetical protein HY788_09355 [Deltaproteobacteria bacterium]|nr:hypothetical protein [Deltaproteobacteria bacterium]